MGKSLTQQLIRIKNEYREIHGSGPASARTMFDWALATDRAKLDLKKAMTSAVADFADALRAETALDTNGNEVRANLAFETQQGWLWDQWNTISHSNMELNVSHSRRNIYGEIKNVVLNVNAYNELHADEEPVQFSLNFAADLADDGIPIPSPIVYVPLAMPQHTVLADSPEPSDPAGPKSPVVRPKKQTEGSFLADAPQPQNRP
jgi:hypothetical protein